MGRAVCGWRRQGGLVRVEDDGQRVTFVSYTTAEGLSSNNTEVIAEDGEGRIFVGGGRGLDRLDPATGRYGSSRPRMAWRPHVSRRSAHP